MRPKYRIVCLTAALFLGIAAAGLAQVTPGVVVTPPPSPASTVQLPYGYSRTDGRVAIDPLLVYVVCRDTSTLVVAPDRVADVQFELQATAASDGSWTLPTGQVLTPQIAQWAIQTPTNGDDVAYSVLDPLPAEAVVMVTMPAAAACQTKVKKHTCVDFKCDGCTDLAQGSVRRTTGEADKTFTFCKPTKNPADECTQTGLFKTCTEIYYMNAGCVAPDRETETNNYYSCKK